MSKLNVANRPLIYLSFLSMVVVYADRPKISDQVIQQEYVILSWIAFDIVTIEPNKVGRDSNRRSKRVDMLL